MRHNSNTVKDEFIALLDLAEVVDKASVNNDNDPSDLSSQKGDSRRGVEKLIPLVESDPLFVSDDGSSYIYRDGKLLQLDSKNKELCEDLRLDGYEDSGKAPSRETVTTVIDLLSAKARRTGKKIELFNKVGERDGTIYYDLADGNAVEITSASWKVIKSPVMFRQMKHHNEQVKPSKTSGDPWKFLDFFQIKEEQRLLFMVTLISSFVPRISHPAIHVSGCQGSGKSVLTSFFKTVIEPSSVLLSVMPRKPDDLDLLFFRYKVVVLDNLSALNFDTCDRLCALISGGTIEKRTLHTDLETTILKANPIILYSSIGSLHSRPDLTERTIVFELQRIPDEKRMEDIELHEKFQEALPVILGGIFDTLSHAIEIYSNIKLAAVPRMAGFARWGYAIAEVLGNNGEKFLADYAGNSSIQTGELIERDTFFASLVETMSMDSRKTLSGSFSEVLSVLMEVAAPGEAKNGYMMLQKDKTFPSARGFRKHIERIRIPLEMMGITYNINSHRTSAAKAFVTIEKMEDEKNDEMKEDLKKFAETVEF